MGGTQWHGDSASEGSLAALETERGRSLPRKYLRKTLEIRAGADEIHVYNGHGDLIRTHDRSYTPKSWVVIPSDMPKEYGDYGYWNKPYFLAKAESVGPNTKILIQNVIE